MPEKDHTMPFKLDDEGRIVTAEVNGTHLPVYVYPDGKEAGFDAEHTLSKIAALNAEAKGHRERAEAAEAKLKSFDGIEDAQAARRALDTMRNLDDKKLVDAGEVERVKSEAIKAVESKYKPLQRERDELAAQINSLLIGGGFARSALLNDPAHPLRLAIPPDVAEAFFGRFFSVEGGRVVAVDQHGNPIYSRSRPGDRAGFDEALAELVNAYPQRDRILAASGSSGAGASTSARMGVVSSSIKNPWARDSMNLTEQGRILRENPAQAAALQAAAG